jgi:uncharacterized surface protein with fasciclin (FAS1) repeats
MKFSYLLLCSVLLLGIQTACKDESGKTEESTTTEAVSNSEENKTAEEPKTKDVLSDSVLAKLMVTEEAKTFARNTLNAGLTDMLSKEDGPFTLLVPSNKAFEGISNFKRESLAQVDNVEVLKTLLENHIIKGEFSTAALTQSVKRNGAHTLKTMGGSNLMVYLDGTNIMVKDSKGVAATIGKSDILATNGLLHIIDSVLTLN